MKYSKKAESSSIRFFFNNFIYKGKGFYPMVFSLAIPIAAQNLITIGVNITDTLMQGMLGETQLSASALATQFVNMSQTFFMGISMGASIMSARYWGSKEMRSLKKTIAIMFRLILLVSFVFAAITLLAPEWVMGMYTSDTSIAEEGIKYLRFCVAAYFLHGLSIGATNILRSIEKVKLPMIVSLISFGLNIAGNYLLMFGKLGFPEMGIAGAALSTLIVRCIECFFNFGYLVFVDKEINYRIKDFFIPTGDLLPEYIRVGAPVILSDGLMALGNNTVMMIVGRMGSHYVAANAVAAIIERLTTSGIGGVGNSCSMLTSKTLGEGRVDEVKRRAPAFVGIGFMLGIIASLLIILIIRPVIDIYNLEGITAQNLRMMMYASAILVLFQSGNGILTKGMLRGGGDTRVLIVADSIFQWIVSIPLGYFVGIYLKLPVFWVYLCLKADNICKTVWSLKRMMSWKWIKKIKSVD